MAQHLLHRSQVGAALQQVRRERVAQRVGRNALHYARPLSAPLDDAPGAHARERPATRIEEQLALRIALVERGPDLTRVERDRPQGPPADRYEALLGPLAEHADQRVVVPHVAHRERDQFAHSHAGGVRHLEQGAVTPGQALVGVGRRQQQLHLVVCQHLGELAPRLGKLQPVAGVPARVPLRHEKTEVRPQRGDLAPDTGRLEAQVGQVIHELAQQLRRHVARLLGSVHRRVLCQAPDVARVVRDRVRAGARLQSEEVLETFDPVGAVDPGLKLGDHVNPVPCASGAPRCASAACRRRPPRRRTQRTARPGPGWSS